MAMNYDAMADEIIRYVGGSGNIRSLTHCITRLRFVLKDEEKADTEAMSKVEGVLKVLSAGGQYQVVVGNKVDGVFDAVCQRAGIGPASAAAEEASGSGAKKGALNALMDTVSGILTPTLGVMVAAGITKGVVSLAATLGWVSADSGLYMILYALGDGFYYYLPILLGVTAARKFGCGEFIGATIGAALVYPAMANIGAARGGNHVRRDAFRYGLLQPLSGNPRGHARRGLYVQRRPHYSWRCSWRPKSKNGAKRTSRKCCAAS